MKKNYLFMGKILLSLSILLVIIFLTGCVYTETTFDINENGKADVALVIKADKIMAGDEVNTFVWALINSFPELQNNYEIKKEIKEIDYSDYLFYTFKSKEPFDINSNRFVEFKKENDKYNFRLKVPSLIEEVTEDNKDDLVFVIKINLPKEIDMANSRIIEGNTVTWKITKADLIKGIELKAFTR